MGFENGFIDFERIEPATRPVSERTGDFREIIGTLSDDEVKIQAGRCMDCGIPFCMHKCPLHNAMPDYNQFTCEAEFKKAYNVLASTNNFPEITGRICPAPCEEACTLGIHRKSVGIRSIEKKVVEYAFEHGFVKAVSTTARSFKKVAVIGSGPAGLSCAQQLTRLGHKVTVIEKNDKIGGLLRYGIPDFKLPKDVLDRRLAQMELEGVTFITSTMVGNKEKLEKGIRNDATHVVTAEELLNNYDAVVLAPGSETPRDLSLPGRDLKGIHFALEFLIAQNRENNGDGDNPISVRDKKVVVIGGGETASDCIGVAIRKGAASVTQIDYHDELPQQVDILKVWPDLRRIKRTSTSQQEGCTRIFSTNTTAFNGKDKISSVSTVKITWQPGHKFTAVEGSEEVVDADIVLIAMGYAHPSIPLIEEFKLETDERGNIRADFSGELAFATSNAKVFAAGDGRRGQSLVVHAIAEGRKCAVSVDRFLNSR
ncbi:MAG: glutamate synthase subunit beta [Succinivibrio sp.]|nr:glutamate synthase subunit beta [Succinivibrio sp.]